MASEISKTQIDRLGDRLKKGNITEEDLRLLDEYRRSFTEAYETVVGAIRNELTLEPTGRPAKSTTSISEKLLRESIRLTQVQDIAGCRLIVAGMAEQERVVQSLGKLFDNVTIVDRREQPSHGYRAVHVIVKTADKLVEIQVRTALQHLWADQRNCRIQLILQSSMVVAMRRFANYSTPHRVFLPPLKQMLSPCQTKFRPRLKSVFCNFKRSWSKSYKS